MRVGTRATLLCLVLVLSGGCGFTLRGSADLPAALRTLQLESPNPDSELVREVRRTLRNNDVTFVEAPNATEYRLGIGSEENRERALSVNANARAGEYELTMSTAVQLRRGAEVVLGPEPLSVSRIYLADPENVVAKNEEAELIRTEMRRELAQQVLRRLQALPL
jgi:LPS-assembly lipoprotein